MKTFPEDQAILFAKNICTAFQCTQAFIIATDGVTVQGASYGKTTLDCKFAGQTLDKIMKLMKRSQPVQTTFTDAQQEEYEYRLEERLGMLCGQDVPTQDQLEIAKQEARESVLLL